MANHQYPAPTGHNAATSPVTLPASSTASMQPLTPLKTAARAAEVILRAYPQADSKATEASAAELTQFISTLTAKELAWVMDVRSGIKARCKFLPTPADINELIAERTKASEFITPTTGGYRKLSKADEERIEQPPGMVRKQQVLELLGYDPSAPTKRTSMAELVPPSASDIEGLGKALKLKQPAVSDATPQLKALLMQPEEERLK